MSEGDMTRGSIEELAAAVRERYRKASKEEKGVMLREFCENTGYHRKSAIRLLGRKDRPGVERRGRRRQYGAEVGRALQQVWEASGRICSKRLEPFMEELVDVLERHEELVLTPELKHLLFELSPASIDRLLRPYRSGLQRQPSSRSNSLSLIRSQVPLRTFSQWQSAQVGEMQADLVLHCGESTEGFYLCTLVAVDVATGWCECQPVWGKGQERVGAAVHEVQARLPFPLRELHTDNGSEFLNHHLWSYCQRKDIGFSRSRPYKKNDQAYVEQRNWTLVRKSVGYDRYCSKAALAALAELYPALCLYVNFFQPLRKLVAKERNGAKLTKHYDSALTPYQRLLEADALSPDQKHRLHPLYLSLNPLLLQSTIRTALERLWPLAHPTLNYTPFGNRYSEASLASR
jgi:hypothetical protein